ncbi:MAG: hypothetical protein KQI62_07700 [Deltaproteobacteria bacterium]|nr:hypothetical protein [Deltaproteobacteria bacterium]
MSMLYIVKTEPTQSTEFLMKSLGEGKEITRYDLYQEQDYDKLVELIFANEEIISWW